MKEVEALFVPSPEIANRLGEIDALSKLAIHWKVRTANETLRTTSTMLEILQT